MRRAVGWVTAASVAGAIAMAFLVPSAGADPPTQQGWWWTANQGPGPFGIPVPPPPPPPDVPADGLLVQGGSSDTSPSAYAAVVYDVPAGATVGQLTLAVTPNSGTTPAATVRACALTNPTQIAAWARAQL